MAWKDVELGFQVAFQAAWEAYLGGSIPIGAAILNQVDEVLSIGRNRIFEESAPRPQIFHHQLAHAEANAILQLSEAEHPSIRKYRLYTTMEPCPFCLGAIAMGSIKQVKYAARDGWAGAASLIRENRYLSNKRIQIEGPFEVLEHVQMIWQTCFELDRHGEGILMENWSSYCPEGIRVARHLHETKELIELMKDKASVEEAFNFTVCMLN